MLTTTEELQRLTEESAIRQVLVVSLWGADHCDVDMIKSAYWPDATYWHIFSSGNAWECQENNVAMLRERTEATAHTLAQTSMTISGDVATCESFVGNFLRIRSADGDPVPVIITAQLNDRVERRDGEWRIADRKIIPEWQLNAEVMIGAEGVATHFGQSRKDGAAT